VFYLFEACLHSHDDPVFLKDAFRPMIDCAAILPSPDQDVTPDFVMGMAKCIRSMSDIVDNDYGQYILDNEATVTSAQQAAYHITYAKGLIYKVTAVQAMHTFKKSLCHRG
jgi:hypothetical protein